MLINTINGAVILLKSKRYDSIRLCSRTYGNAAEILAGLLGEKGVKDIAVYNASTTHFSEIVAECFKYSHIVFACATYNMSLFPPMQIVLHEVAEHNLQNRTFAFVENGTWARRGKTYARIP